MLRFTPLDAAIDWAVANPDEFYIHAWFLRTPCGTTACIAGRLATEAGWTPHLWTAPDANGASRTVMVRKGGDFASVAEVAAKHLGLDTFHDRVLINDLFHAEDLATVISLRNRLARDAGLPERTWTVPG